MCNSLEDTIYESSEGELNVNEIVSTSLRTICDPKVIRKTFKLVGLSPFNPQGIYDPRDLTTIPDSKRRRHELRTTTPSMFFKQEPRSDVSYVREIPEVSTSETSSSSDDESAAAAANDKN